MFLKQHINNNTNPLRVQSHEGASRGKADSLLVPKRWYNKPYAFAANRFSDQIIRRKNGYQTRNADKGRVDHVLERS